MLKVAGIVFLALVVIFTSVTTLSNNEMLETLVEQNKALNAKLAKLSTRCSFEVKSVP